MGTGDVPLLIRTWKLADGVHAEAAFADTTLEVLDVRLSNLDPYATEPWGQTTWSMVRGLPMRLGDEDSFGWWKDRVFGEFVDRRFGERSKRTEAERAEMSQVAAQLKVLARDLAVHTADTCDPALRKLALRFPTGARLRMYSWFAGDPSGRLSAAAMTCPGPLLFAVGASEYCLPRTVRTVLDGIRRGMPTRKVVEQAVAKWNDEARGRDLTHREWRAPSLHVPCLSSEDVEPFLAAQRSLVLCAGHAVPPSWVVSSPPLAFHPDDVPLGTRANARWFRMMKTAAVARTGESAETEIRRKLSSLLSRRGLPMFSDLPWRWSVSDAVDALLGFVIDRGLRLDTDTDLPRVLSNAIPWYAARQSADPLRGKYDRFRAYCSDE